MRQDFVVIPDADVPKAVDSTCQHAATSYASRANKLVSAWRAVPNSCFVLSTLVCVPPCISTTVSSERLPCTEQRK